MKKSLSHYKIGQKGLMALLIIVVAVMLVVANIAASMVTQRSQGLTFDLTANSLFKLSDETVNFIDTLKQPVTIKVLAKEEMFVSPTKYNMHANEIFKAFTKASGKITLEYINYTADPTFSSNYSDLSMKHGDILVQSGEKYTLIPTEDLFNFTATPTGGLVISSSRAESAINEALLKVTSEKSAKAVFTTGHVETVMESFNKLLINNNYQTESISLVTQDIPADTDLLLIVAPEKDFSEQELAKLDAFLENSGQYGKTVAYFADASKPRLPNLAVFLQEWGIAVEEGLVFETDPNRVYEYQPFYAVADYADKDYQSQFSPDGLPIIMPISKPLSAKFESRGNYTTRVLLTFGETAGVRPADAGSDFTAEKAEKWGPFPAMILSEIRPAGAENKSTVVALSSTLMLDSYFIDSPVFSNADYTMGIINSLMPGEKPVMAQPKSIAGSALGITQGLADNLGMVFTAVIPGMILLCGLLVWLRRRNK